MIGTRTLIAAGVLAMLVLPVASMAADGDDARQLARQARELLDAGRYAEAADIAAKALALRERAHGPNHAETAESMHDLAEAYRALGQYGKALPLAKRALDIRTRLLGADDARTASAMNDLGLLHFEMGDCREAADCREALPLIEKALGVRKRTLKPSDPLLAESLNNVAVIYRAQKRYQDAQPLFEQALAIKENALDPTDPRLATAHMNLAALFMQWADESADAGARDNLRLQAVDHLQAAKAVLRAGGNRGPADRLLAARTLTTLARFYWKMGTISQGQARELLQQALQIRVEVLGDHHPDTAQSRNLLAAFYQSAAAQREALQVYREGLAADDAVIATVLFSAAADEQKLQFLRKAQWHYWAALSLIQRHFGDDDAAVRLGLELVLRRKGIILDSQSRVRAAVANSLSGPDVEAWNRLTQYRTDLSRLLLSGPVEQTPAAWRQEVATLQSAITADEDVLAQRSEPLARERDQRALAVAKLATYLPADSALVEIVRIRDWDEREAAWAATYRYLAFTLTPENRVKLIDLGDAPTIDDAVEQARKAIADVALFERDLKAYGQETDDRLADLYNHTLQPVEAAIGARRHLVVSPDGDLNRIPFEAFRTANGRYLVEERLVSYVTSGRDLTPRAASPAPAVKLLLVASPAFDDKNAVQARGDGTRALRPPFRQKFGPLPGTKQEAQLIPPLVSGEQKVLLGEEARESAVRETRAPQVLHLATHGFFLPASVLAALIAGPDDGGDGRARVAGSGDDAESHIDNPMIFSGLALAGANYANQVTQGDDGILTALEVSGMNLYGTDLVVLSACETGLGKVEVGEGVYGLRRAFVLAGAKNLVMSLWPVDDDTTRDLMVQFYRAYAGGDRVATALHKAQLAILTTLREKYQVAPVNLWAPFIAQQEG